VYKVYLAQKAEKEIYKLSSVDSRKVLEKIPLLKDPFSQNLDIKKLTNSPGFYRLRIGNVRMIFVIDNKKNEVIIRKIGYRGNIYR